MDLQSIVIHNGIFPIWSLAGHVAVVVTFFFNVLFKIYLLFFVSRLFMCVIGFSDGNVLKCIRQNVNESQLNTVR